MKKVTCREEQERILLHLKKHLTECIYLTIDLEIYGYTHPEVEFWYDEKEGEVETVLMKYYDSFQIFSANENWDASKSAEFMKSYMVKTICGKESMIIKLAELMPEYKVQYGIVVKEDSFKEFKQFELVRSAVPEDAREIAELLLTDEDFGTNYSLDGLEKQLSDRMKEKKGRSFVMVEDHKIVAHTAIYAECEDVAVESGLIVHEDYQKKFYGMIIHEFIKKKLLTEGKTLYGFRIVDNMQRYAKAVGMNVCGHYGKMTRE